MIDKYAATTYYDDLLDILDGLPGVVPGGFPREWVEELTNLLARLQNDEEITRDFEVFCKGRPERLTIGFYGYGKDAWGQESAEINIAAEQTVLVPIEQFIESVILRGD